jgi:alkylation response protein AidB-like acyl-CoA dehydrogenase
MPVSIRDMQFLMHEVLDFDAHYRSLDLSDPPSRELLDAIVDEAARFTENEIAPLNRVGDEQGCRLADGQVTTPSGFKEAYAKYIEGGWAGLSGDPEYGGQGLPGSVSLFLEDLMCCANMAWTMYPGLSRGAISALQSHGSSELKGQFLGKLLSGKWTGTMCLTEAHAGSDVGLAKTKAVLRADGSYAVTGTKIFISAGDHDMAENIVHLVLARLPDAPEGTKGISMFVVPKINLDGSRNSVTCGAIEEKMGIHGNATCVLHFEDATGHLVGKTGEGMRYMFTMMNAARLVVGLQGACQAHAAFLRSAEYARERLQMRSLTGPKAPEQAADPIIVHPDVRRMLLFQRAVAEGGRALVYYTGQVADRASHGPVAERASADELLDFLTPIVKGTLTELGFESVNQAVQIYGGHGFIRETGVEQYVRDVRISMIYEGTTQIQALDLLGRKVLQNQGKGLVAFSAEMQALAASIETSLPDIAAGLKALAGEWGELTMNLGAKAAEDLDELGAAAVDYLFYSGYAALAFSWGLIARAAIAVDTGEDNASVPGDNSDPFVSGKLAVARFYFARVLPRVRAHKAAIEAGKGSIMDVCEDALTAL